MQNKMLINVHDGHLVRRYNGHQKTLPNEEKISHIEMKAIIKAEPQEIQNLPNSDFSITIRNMPKNVDDKNSIREIQMKMTNLKIVATLIINSTY